MSTNDDLGLPNNIRRFLEKVSKPLEESIKQKHNKELLKNDYLITASRIDIIMEKIFAILAMTAKNETERDKIFTTFVDLLIALFSQVLILFCISIASFQHSNPRDKQRDKILASILKDLHRFSKKFIFKYRK